MPNFTATCAKGLEYLLVDELTALNATNAKEGLSQVGFEADWKTLYQILMWSRLASRVLYPIADFEATDDEMLYKQASIIDWSQHIKPSASILVNSQSFKSKLSHTQFISQRIKDAIVDYFEDNGDLRPNVEFENPDVMIHCRVRKNRTIISIDLSGGSMHKRGYRVSGGGAPLKENLAAALLMRAGWPSVGSSLYDPMCGSATFLIEGAYMALGIAPGLMREHLGIYGWEQFQRKLWEEIENEAFEIKEAAIKECKYTIVGSDINPRAIRAAQSNIAKAGLETVIKVHIAGLDQLGQLDLPKNGLLVVNPPYSERLGEFEEVKSLYKLLGEILKSNFKGWNASVISPEKDFGHALGVRAKKIYKFSNGSIPCELLNLELVESNFIIRSADDKADLNYKDKLNDNAVQLNNRLEKNIHRLKKFISKNDLSCYRVYDADLPDYNAAVDYYDGNIYIQEYKAPKSVDDKTALRRIKDLETVSAGIFKLPKHCVTTKQRRKQKGDWQYGKNIKVGSDSEQSFHQKIISEFGRRFEINLVDYIDTGIFLDHRLARKFIGANSKNKRFLNLFCYTGTASVFAATGGAAQTVSVDMSNTYIQWAKRNFKLNKISPDPEKHQFIRENCLTWLESAVQNKLKFDLIFLDPPTFSNSKKMDDDFDIQTKHAWLINQCLELLDNRGEILFSNNYQKFQMEVSSDERISVKEITRLTSSEDFKRKNLHRCWSIKLNN